MHPSAQAVATDTPPNLPTLNDAQAEIIGGLTLTLNGLLLGGAILLSTVIYALYNSVPPTFQSAFIEALRGVIAVAEETLAKQAVSAKLTPSDLDDRIVEAVNKAVSEFAKRFDKPPTDTL